MPILRLKPKHTTGHKRLVLGCGALVHDMLAVIQQNAALRELIDVRCLPAKLHNAPQLIAGEVDKVLAQVAHRYQSIVVAYGDCGTAGALDAVLEKYAAQRIAGAHCYEFFAGSEVYQEITDEQLGSFFLTDYLVKNFDRLVIKGLGLDRYPELYDAYFKHYHDLVYLAQTDDPQLQTLAQQHAETLRLRYRFQYTGVSGLSPLLGELNAASKIRVEVANA